MMKFDGSECIPGFEGPLFDDVDGWVYYNMSDIVWDLHSFGIDEWSTSTGTGACGVI